jgi:alkyl sulfatase BDS1-like metallo-beta-lactamase superfamily hydrolase
MNKGLTGSEIAEVLDVPPALDAVWHTHGYYGPVSHNVKAIQISASAGVALALTVTQLFDTVAIRINGPRSRRRLAVRALALHRQRRAVPHAAVHHPVTPD